MKNPSPLTSFSVFHSAVLFGLAAGPALGQTWNGGNGSWNTSGNWTPAGVPVSGVETGLVFEGSGDASYTATNNIGPFTLNSLTVNHTGTGTVTLAGSAAANTYTFAGANPSINVPSGTALFSGLMTGSATVTKTGSGTFIHDSNNTGFTGTLIVDGGTFVNQSTLLATTNFNPVSIVVNSGATYQFGAAGVGNPNLPNSTYVTVNTGGLVSWQEGEDYGGFNLYGGTLISTHGAMNLNGSTASEFRSGLIVGPSAVGGTSAAGINKTTAGVVTVRGANISNTGPLNIQEGVLETNTGFTGAGLMTLGTATNSAVLRYNGTGGTVVNARALTVNAGGGVVSNTVLGAYSQSGTVTLNGVMTKQGNGNYTITGATAGTGGMRVDEGTLTLAGPIGHSGATVVNTSAFLRVSPGAAPSASPVELGFRGTMSVDGGNTGAGTFTLPSLNLATGGATVALELNTPSAPATQVAVANPDGLILNGGGHTLSLRNFKEFTPGTITAISYQGAEISSGFTLDAGRHNASLNYNTAAKTIEILVAGGTEPVKWSGALTTGEQNNVWDTDAGIANEGNWRRSSDGTGTSFIRTDRVIFDDSAVMYDVAPAGSRVEPASVTFDNTKAYTFGGPSGIYGPGGLEKNGSGPVTLAGTHGYTGGTVVNAGSLILPAGASIAGNVSLRGGTLAIASQAVLENSSVITMDGGTLRFTGNYASAGNQMLAFQAGGGTLEVDAGILATKNGAAFSGPGTLTKTGGGILSIQVGGGADFTGAVNINDGAFRFTSTRLVNADTMTVNAGGTLLIQDTTSYNNGSARFVTGAGKSLVLNGNGYEGGGAWRHVLDEAGSAVMGVDSPVVLASTSRITLEAGISGTRTPEDTVTNIFHQPVSGPGGLIKDGAGTLILAAANTYTGSTVIEKGHLLVPGTLAAESGVTVNGGTLGGTGIVNGLVTLQSGGTLSPGASIESLVAGSVTFNTGSAMLYEFTTAALDGDLLDVRGDLTLTGSVTLTLADLGVSTALPVGSKLSLISYDGVWNGGTFSGFADDSVFTSGLNDWMINYNDISGGTNQGGGTGAHAVTLTAVPEPGTLLSGFAAAMAFLFRRRRW